MEDLPGVVPEGEELPKPSRRAIIVFLVIYIASRVPFLGLGYGYHQDPWSVAVSGERLWLTGQYSPSRGVGYPLHEAITGLLCALGGNAASNTGSVLVSLACVALFCAIVRWHRMPHASLLVWCFAFLPLFWGASVTTADYLWALAAMLGAYYQGLRGCWVWAWVLTGIGVGFRATTALFLLPLALMMRGAGEPNARIAKLAAVGLMTGALCDAPSLLWVLSRPATVGGVFNAGPNSPAAAVGVGYGFVYLLGLLATGWVAIEGVRLSVHRKGTLSNPSLRGTQALPLYCLGGSYACLQWFEFDKVSYLIPCLWLVLLLVAVRLPRRSMAIFVLLALSYGFVSIDLKGGDMSARKLELHVRPGIVLADYIGRRALLDFREAAPRFDPPEPCVILTGMNANLSYGNPGMQVEGFRLPGQPVESTRVTQSGRVVWAYGITPANADACIAAGWRIYCVKTALWNLRMYPELRGKVTIIPNEAIGGTGWDAVSVRI